jgi:zinc protease
MQSNNKMKFFHGLCLVAALSLCALPAQAGVKIQSWQAKSGAKVLFVENHDLPMLDVAVHVDAGGRRDVPERAGCAAMAVGLMQMGAAGLSEETIAKRLADVGAQMGPSFDRDRAGYSLRTLSSPRERMQALDMMAQVLQAPDFPDAVLQREKTRTLAGLREDETKPAAIADKAFYKALYGAHPYGLPSEGEIATVSKLTRDDLVRFYQDHYGASRAVVSMIGDVSRAEAEAIAEQLTARLPARASQAPLPPVEPLAQPQVQRIPHPATQAHILMGAPGIARGDPDYFTLYVGNYVLGGGGFDSRILNEIRQKRGLAYSAYSYFIPLLQPGPFQLGMQTKKQDADVALKVAQETLNKYIQEGPSAAELKQAKNNIVLGFPLRIDNNRKLLEYLGVIGYYKLPLTYLDDFPRLIEKVSAREIQEAFKRHLHPDKMVTVMVGAPEAAAQ